MSVVSPEQWRTLRAAFPDAKVVMPPPFVSHASGDTLRSIERDQADEAKRSVQTRIAAKWASLTPPEATPPPAHYPTAELDWYADQGHFSGPEEAREISESDRAFAASAQGEFFALCKEKTGQSMDPEKLEEMRDDHAKLLAQSHSIAEKMGSAGFNAYRSDASRLFRYYVHSGHTEALPNFRRCTFIPYVAQGIRAPMVTALEAFLEHEPFARMWTMTSGPRVPIAGIRERAKWMHGKLSDLNAQPFMREAGVEIVFRSTELGSPETDANGNVMSNAGEIERDESGQLYFHVHAHCVVIQRKGFIPPKKWSAFLTKVGEFWVHWWKDGSENRSGLICDPREVCKYVTKPGEMVKLTGPELVALQAQLSRLKLVQPMGTLADEIRTRAEKNLRLVTTRTPDGPVYREVKNWNRHARRTRTEKHSDAAAKLARPEAPNALKVVARCIPGFGPAGVAEPRVVLMGNVWDERAARTHPAVAALIRATAHEFWAGHAIRVHTCTSTVLSERQFDFVSKLDPPRSQLTGAEQAGFAR